MASSTVRLSLPAPALSWLVALLWRLGGLALVAGGVFLAVALAGFDPADPSFNSLGEGAPANPAGLAGAYLADAVYQVVGLSGWLLPLVLCSWGLRLLLARPLRWPWLPLVALPPALLAISALLASFPIGADGGWPFRVGLGGVVGDFVLWRLQPRLGAEAYFWSTLAAAVVLGITALGLRWRESWRAAGRVGSASLWLGRHVSRAASSAGEVPGRILRPGPRPTDPRPRTVAEDVEAFAEEEEIPDAPRRGLLARITAWLQPEERDIASAPLRLRRPAPPIVDPEAEPEAPAPTPESRRPARRPARRRREKPVPEAPPPVPAERDGHGFVLPGLDLLAVPRHHKQAALTKSALAETARRLESVLDDFGVRGEIVDAKPGPVVTLFELEPAPGTRAQRVINLADDIARSLCALSVRVATIPGRNVIGIELPNPRRETVYLRELLESEVYRETEARLPLALGKDIGGEPVVVDLARMPHLLIAGTTGAGKSVAINAMILSLLYRLTPEQCRIILIDPKVIELSVYEDIPHLLAPVVTEPHKAVVALKWVVRQMDERYRLMSHMNVRDIFSYNRRLMQARARGQRLTRRVRVGFEAGTGAPIFEEQEIDMTPLPLIVVVVDEVADLMLTAGKEIEGCIQRLSQKARAAGIHLVVATQRPSVDVLTGVIKANLPSRISFRVSSKIDSRTILNEPGAEQLLGQGDMLYLMPGDRITRIHGPLVTDQEVEEVVAHLKAQGEPDYLEDITSEAPLDPGPAGPAANGEAGGQDGLYEQAVQIVARDGKASTSYLQRKLSIGYNTAARLIERMEAEGLISEADHVGRRRILMKRGDLDEAEGGDYL